MARRYRWRHDSLLNFLYDIVCRDQNCCSKRWSDFLWPVWPNWESPLLLFTLIWTSISIFNWMSETQTHFICYLLVFVNFFYKRQIFNTKLDLYKQQHFTLASFKIFLFFHSWGVQTASVKFSLTLDENLWRSHIPKLATFGIFSYASSSTPHPCE